MDDAWSDMFAKAEGSADVTAQYAVEDTSDQPSSQNSRKRKRKKKSYQLDKEEEDAFRAMLEARMDVPKGDSKWPKWVHLEGSLIQSKPDSSCSEFEACESDGKGGRNLCQNCQQSAVCHKISVLETNNTIWPIHMLSNLRNIRCAAKLWIFHPKTKAKRVNRSLKEQLKAFQNYASLASQSLPPSEASLLESRAERLRSSTQTIINANHYCFEDLVRVIMACDDVYYRLYYLQITHQLTPMKSDCFLPHPQDYFGSDNLTLDFSKELMWCKEFLSDIQGSDDGGDKNKRKDLLQRVGMDGMDKEDVFRLGDHPLLTLRRLRFVETVSIFYRTKWCQSEARKKEVQESLERDQSDEEEEETPAPPLLMAWRDSCRDFLCHLYAYATLSAESLESIPRFLTQHAVSAGILEYGAGTGYLAKVLAEKSTVRPLDVCPTLDSAELSTAKSQATTNGMNEFHGLAPSFLPVHHGSVDTLQKDLNHSTKAQNVALLLCYPPPHSNMAYDMLKTFANKGGRTFIHIGEFRGLTGNKTFEKYLLQHFECQERQPCLSWGSDASEVTLWMRRKSSKKHTKVLLLPCSFCGKAEALRRCRLLRYLVYCSSSCCDLDEPSRNRHLRMNMVDLRQTFGLIFQNEMHFSVLK